MFLRPEPVVVPISSRRMQISMLSVAAGVLVAAMLLVCSAGVEAAGGKKASPMLIEEDGARRHNRQAGKCNLIFSSI